MAWAQRRSHPLRPHSPDPAPRLWHLALRLGATLATVALCLWFLATRLGPFDADAIAQSFAAVRPVQWAFGIAAVFVAFLAVGRQERVILRHFGIALDRRHLMTAAMATAGVSQCVGFGPVVGAMIRARLLPELGLRQSFMVSAATTVGFFSGAAMLALVFLGLNGSALAGLAAAGVLGAIAARSLWGDIGWRGIELPRAAAMLALLFWVGLDLMGLSFAFWVLLPPGHGMDWVSVVVSFTLALTFGLMSGSPAGTGPFEALVLLQMPDIAPAALVAGLLAFRGVAYVVPALLSGLWIIVGHRLLRPPIPLPMEPVAPQALLASHDRAEVLLARQGDLDLRRDDRGQVWAMTVLGRARVLVGEPSAPKGWHRRSLDPALDLCRAEGRVPLFYKIGPRQATEARRRRFALLRIALEAVIDPKSHSTEGPRHASLRRKLRHAVKAGVVVRDGGALPLDEMQGVAEDWARRHGGERGLTTGRWGAEYVAGQRVFLAHDTQGRLLAFATFHVTAEDWVLDLIRFGQDTPDGTLYLIVQTAIEAARRAGAARLSLAAVPCEGFGVKGALGRRLRPLSAKARGLFQFKAAFAPRWEPRYAAAPGWLGLSVGLLLLAAAIRLKRVEKRPRPVAAGALRLWVAEGKVSRLLRPDRPDDAEDRPARRKRRAGG
ncbi:phosphatidylglycerol lysyltransferase domain-containing protein [Rhodobacter sp. KR11]|uniref:phosphatidylglycerol lysyltransferase domain-containing protein n=1 Tax=Rhodobacter sp. KR11 TaxID=2974588 RepID=UPI00222288BA|nr:phosphatidylglycerol lysyltransferase domain-containing protein [Rhodobacter sp. KR11]